MQKSGIFALRTVPLSFSVFSVPSVADVGAVSEVKAQGGDACGGNGTR